MLKFRLILTVLTVLLITVNGQFGVNIENKSSTSSSKSAASKPSGNFAIPTALRRPNPFLQRLPSAAADQEALFQSKTAQAQPQPSAQSTNKPSFQNGQQSGGNQPMYPNQPDPYQTGSYQGPYNSMNSNNNNPPTMAGPVPADRISYQPAPKNTVQSGYQQPMPGQQSMQVPNNGPSLPAGPSYDLHNQYPPQQN
nr:RecName: Full=Uncharacterized shell protein 22; Short=LUSP-22; Flags: Precursor [Lottia gigantea]